MYKFQKMKSIKNFKLFSFLLIILLFSVSSCEDEPANSKFLGSYDVVKSYTGYSGVVPPGYVPSEYIMFIESSPSGSENEVLFRNIEDAGEITIATVTNLDFILESEIISGYGTFSSDGQSLTFYYDDGYGHSNGVATKR